MSPEPLGMFWKKSGDKSEKMDKKIQEAVSKIDKRVSDIDYFYHEEIVALRDLCTHHNKQFRAINKAFKRLDEEVESLDNEIKSPGKTLHEINQTLSFIHIYLTLDPDYERKVNEVERQMEDSGSVERQMGDSGWK